MTQGVWSRERAQAGSESWPLAFHAQAVTSCEPPSLPHRSLVALTLGVLNPKKGPTRWGWQPHTPLGTQLQSSLSEKGAPAGQGPGTRLGSCSGPQGSQGPRGRNSAEAEPQGGCGGRPQARLPRSQSEVLEGDWASSRADGRVGRVLSRGGT